MLVMVWVSCSILESATEYCAAYSLYFTWGLIQYNSFSSHFKGLKHLNCTLIRKAATE